MEITLTRNKKFIIYHFVLKNIYVIFYIYFVNYIYNSLYIAHIVYFINKINILYILLNIHCESKLCLFAVFLILHSASRYKSSSVMPKSLCFDSEEMFVSFAGRRVCLRSWCQLSVLIQNKKCVCWKYNSAERAQGPSTP